MGEHECNYEGNCATVTNIGRKVISFYGILKPLQPGTLFLAPRKAYSTFSPLGTILLITNGFPCGQVTQRGKKNHISIASVRKYKAA